MNFSNRRFDICLRLIFFILQLLCCLATIATFARLLDEFKLPMVFTITPVLLILLISLEKCLIINDRKTNCMIRGIITGFLAGFFGNVVNDEFIIQTHTSKNSFVLWLANFEFLHIPVIAGTVMCMFCIIFRKFPPRSVLVVAFAFAVCCMSITSLLYIFYSINPDRAKINKQWAMVVFIVAFLFGLMPTMTQAKQAWLLCLCGFVVSVNWQFVHLETQQWDWSLNRYPIPGFLTVYVVLFLYEAIDVGDSNIYLYKNRKKKKFDLETRMSDNEDDDDKNNDCERSDRNILPNEENGWSSFFLTMTCHCLSYLAERTVMTLVKEVQQKNRAFKTDTWLCCLCMLCFYYLLASKNNISILEKVSLTILGLLLYFCVGVTSGILSNGYFIDNVVGILFLAVTLESEHSTNF
ncbi:hypothetical protein HELRODRAFT_168490 [Helobdella robusta]|uniref:Uncharacterized protein n=1 Tax=Helobdella robusta TaxID=6412 RepID=T1F0M7_HELRO|nr:hypothetical protein HELRODRAFT_168490 [Helobdella robusta]ESO09497.1 hypothetical protein HELRODRAFT_168490 [Helobdella robusta]